MIEEDYFSLLIFFEYYLFHSISLNSIIDIIYQYKNHNTPISKNKEYTVNKFNRSTKLDRSQQCESTFWSVARMKNFCVNAHLERSIIYYAALMTS